MIKREQKMDVVLGRIWGPILVHFEGPKVTKKHKKGSALGKGTFSKYIGKHNVKSSSGGAFLDPKADTKHEKTRSKFRVHF